MNHFLKRSLAVLMLLSLCLSLTACKKRISYFKSEQIKVKQGEVKAYPDEAFFEKDGSFKVSVGIANGLAYTKCVEKITMTISDKDKNLIAQGEFAIEESAKPIVKAGAVGYITCMFNKDEVKMASADLKILNSDITLKFSGAMKDAEPVETKKDGVNAHILDANYKSDGSLRGVIKIVNNSAAKASLKSIVFDVKDSTGKKYTKTKVKLDVNTELDAGASVNKEFTIAKDNLDNTTDAFDYLTLDYIIGQ
ncbi:MAG: hypothetical protein BGN88_02330 [Clostridiales bacterium 43-6]|nr:MAG: hypothetical protein BGN88_02330 [Clostridiales bacterium 43-6]